MKIAKPLTLILLIAVLVSLFTVPFDATSSTDMGVPPTVSAQQFVLMDAKTGQILLEKNMHQTVHPASTTKIVTNALAALSGILPSETTTVSKDAIDDGQKGASSHIAIDYGETLSLKDLMYGSLLHSGNDASNAIAEMVAGKQFSADQSPTFEEKIAMFTSMMNEFAESAGALNTNFTNAHGMYEENHVTTAYDMALVLRSVMEINGLREIMSTVSYTIPATNKKEARKYITNGNNLLKTGEFNYPFCIGGKTGYTEYSGYGFVAMAEKNGRQLIVAVYNCTDGDARFADAINLFNYGFNYFKEVTVGVEKLPRSPKQIIDGEYITGTATVYADKPITVLLHFTVSEDAVVITNNTPEVLSSSSPSPTYTLSISDDSGTYMYPEIGTFPLTSNTTMLESPIKISGDDGQGEGENSKPDKEKKPVSTASVVLLIVFIIILVVLAVLIFFYLYSNITRQKRARERRRDRLGDRSVYTKHRPVSPAAVPTKKKATPHPQSKASARPSAQKPAVSERGTRYAKEEPVTTGRRYKQ